VSVEASLIMGVALGIEYVQADEDADIPHSCLVIDLLVFRIIVEFTGE
jgi:hypothetical protein